MANKKRNRKHNLGGCVKQGGLPQLSDVQAEYLRLFTVEHLTPNLIKHRRQVSMEAVRKMRRWLIQNGYMDARYNAVVSKGFSTQPGAPSYGKNWTLHGLEYKVDIISGYDSKSYLSAKGRGQGVIAVKGSSVMLFDRVIKLKVGQVFESDHPEKAMWKSCDYLFGLLRVLESDLGVLLLKDRVCNVHRVKGEFSRMNDTLALKPGASDLRVYSGDDGLLRWKVDWSPGSFPEVEALHYKHGEGDAVKYEFFLRDLVERPSLPLSELSAAIAELSRQQLVIQSQLRDLIEVSTLNAKLLSSDLESRRFRSVDSSSDFSELRKWT